MSVEFFPACSLCESSSTELRDLYISIPVHCHRYVFLPAALSCCEEAHAALVVVEGSDLLRFGSDAAGGLGLAVGGVGAVLNRCAEAVDTGEGLSGVSLQDGGSTV